MGPSVRIDSFSVGLSEPIHTARGTVFERDGLVLVLGDGQGNWGRGEVAPLAGWSSVDLDGARAQLEAAASDLERDLSAAVTGVAPEVRAAVDTAQVSLAASRDGLPLWRHLGGEDAAVRVNALAVGPDAAAVGDEVRRHVASGHHTIKVKLGMPDDADRIRASARAVAGTNTRIRFDANGAWGIAEAIELLAVAAHVLGPALEYVEDPVLSIEGLGRLREETDVRLAADDIVRSPDDLRRVLDAGLADAVVIKPALIGGITPTRALADTAARAGVDVVVSSLYDGPVGLAAWCHLAASLNSPVAHGLGTAALLTASGAAHLVPRAGVISL